MLAFLISRQQILIQILIDRQIKLKREKSEKKLFQVVLQQNLLYQLQNFKLVLVLALSQIYQLINKNMQKKEEVLWKKLNVQITPNHESLKVRRRSIEPLPSINLAIIDKKIQSEQENSPTFKKQASQKQQPKRIESESQCFSFGQKILQEIEHMLRQSDNSQISCLLPVCVQCDSFEVSKDKNISEQHLKSILAKLSRFVYDTKYFIEGVKMSIRNYKDSFQSQKIYWQNYIQLILSNIGSKTTKERSDFEERIKQLQEQKGFALEKCRLLQKRSLSLEHQITQIAQSLSSERLLTQQLNKKIYDLNQHLQAKQTQTSCLLEDNMNMKLNLKKFMAYANQMTSNTLQLTSSNCKTPENYKSMSNCEEDFLQPKLKQKTDLKNMRPRKQSISSAITSYQKSNLFDFSQSMTIFSARTQQQVTLSPIAKRHSYQTQTVLQQKEKNCEKKVHLMLQQKNQISPKLKSEDMKSNSKSRRIEQVIPNAQYRKYSSQKNQIQSGIPDKGKILDRIKKLKEDINYQIRDLQSPIIN